MLLSLFFLYSCNDEVVLKINDGALSSVYTERDDLPDIKTDVLLQKAGKNFKSSCYKLEVGPYYAKNSTYFDSDILNSFLVGYELEIFDSSLCNNLVDYVYYEYKINKMSLRATGAGRYDINLEILGTYDINWDEVSGLAYTPIMASLDPFHTHYKNVGEIDYQVLEFYEPGPLGRFAETILIPFEYKSSGDSYLQRRSESSVLGMLTVVAPVILVPIGI